MKPVRDLVGRVLEWKQPRAMKREFDLRDGDDVVAALRFRSQWGSLATLETADGSWTFKRVGFWRTRVTVREAHQDIDIAVFTNATWNAGGTLEMADGRRLLANTNTWNTKYEFKTEAEEPLVHFEKIGGMFHLGSRMVIEPVATRWKELPWLVGLGWYLAVKMHDDAAGAAAAASG